MGEFYSESVKLFKKKQGVSGGVLLKPSILDGGDFVERKEGWS